MKISIAQTIFRKIQRRYFKELGHVNLELFSEPSKPMGKGRWQIRSASYNGGREIIKVNTYRMKRIRIDNFYDNCIHEFVHALMRYRKHSGVSHSHEFTVALMDVYKKHFATKKIKSIARNSYFRQQDGSLITMAKALINYGISI